VNTAQQAAWLSKLPAAVQRRVLWHFMTPEQRAAWCEAHPHDTGRMRRADEKRARKGLANG
jgi:hypothetical protein